MKVPTKLSSEEIAEFKAIYYDEFGETLTDGEAEKAALRLIAFFSILTRK